MIPESILLYWSKGAEIRRKIIIVIDNFNKKNQACFSTIIAKKLKISHVALKKHIDLLKENDYISKLNPKGKPVFFIIAEKGKKFIKKLSKSKSS